MACDNKKLNVVVNHPGDLDFFNKMGFFLPQIDNMEQCCGTICIMETMKETMMKKAMGKFN